MLPRVATLLGVRQGEGGRTLRLFALILLLTLTVALAKAAQQGIFLAHAGREQIADAFIVSALALAVASFAVSALAARLGPVRLFVGLGVTVAGLFTAAGLLSAFNANPLPLYVLVEASVGLIVVQGWSVAGEALDVRSAKRLLPLIGNAAGLGWTIGGFAVKPLSQLLGASWLLPLAAGLLAGAAVLALAVERLDIGTATRPQGKPTLWSAAQSGVAQIAREPLLQALAALAVTGMVTEQLLDYVLFTTAQQELHSKERIASFMGAFYGATGAISLLAPLVAGRILGRFGSATTAQFPAGAALVFALALAVHPVFAAAVLGRGAYRVMESALGSAARGQMQTALSGVQRAQGNALVKGVVAPAFYALGGVGLKLAPAVDLRWLGALTVLLSAASMAVAGNWLRRAYASLVRRSIDHRKLQLDDAARLDDEQVRALANELYCGHRERELLAAEILSRVPNNPVARNALRGACALPDTRMQQHALRALGHNATHADTATFVGVLRQTDDSAVRKSALRGLVRSSGNWQAEVIESADADQPTGPGDVKALRNAQILAKHCGKAGPCQGERCERPCGPALGELAELSRRADAAARETAAWALGEIAATLRPTVDLLMALAADPQRPVSHAAYAALGHMRDPAAVDCLARGLADPANATAAMAGVTALDDDATAWFAPLLPTMPAHAQRSLAAALGAMAHPASVDLLGRMLLLPARSVRYRAARALAARQRQHTVAAMPQRAIVQAARDEIRSALQAQLVLCGIAHRHRDTLPSQGPEGFFCREVQARIALCQRRLFAQLSLLCDPRAVELAEYHCKRPDTKAAANALELLESALPGELRQDVLLVIDHRSLRDRFRALRDRAELDQTAATDPLGCVMGAAGDDYLRLCAILPYGADMATRYPDQHAQSMAKIAQLQRVQFLRAVSLFDPLSGEDLLQIAATASEVRLETGAQVFAKGDPSQEIYLVVQGSVALQDGAATIATAQASDLFGELAALDGEPRSASAVCAEPTVLLCIARADLDEIMERKPQVAREFIRVLARRLRASTARLGRN